MSPPRYATPAALKQALEHQLKVHNPSSAALARARQIFVFERFLARVVRCFGHQVMLKGGFALELRLEQARTTRDLDLRVVGSPERLLERLQEAGQLALGEFMEFGVHPDPHHPMLTGEGLPYDGYRYRVTCYLAGKVYGAAFHVDLAVGGPILEPAPLVELPRRFQTFELEETRVLLCPIETHLAEKLHAYTLPREHMNSRMKDLPDMVLLAAHSPLRGERMQRALLQTFEFRATHLLPLALPPPPQAWAASYSQLAREMALTWTTLEELNLAARAFFDPLLSREASELCWEPVSWCWQACES